jgi:hypothetical protein
VSARARWIAGVVGLLAVNLIAAVVLAVMAGAEPPQLAPGYDGVTGGRR